MKMYRVDCFVDDRIISFVNDKGNVREWLRWMLDNNDVKMGRVMMKDVNCIEDLENWGYKDIWWKFIVEDDKVLWGKWWFGVYR